MYLPALSSTYDTRNVERIGGHQISTQYTRRQTGRYGGRHSHDSMTGRYRSNQTLDILRNATRNRRRNSSYALEPYGVRASSSGLRIVRDSDQWIRDPWTVDRPDTLVDANGSTIEDEPRDEIDFVVDARDNYLMSIRSIGYDYLKPPGVTKTMRVLAEEAEELEAQEEEDQIVEEEDDDGDVLLSDMGHEEVIDALVDTSTRESIIDGHISGNISAENADSEANVAPDAESTNIGAGRVNEGAVVSSGPNVMERDLDDDINEASEFGYSDEDEDEIVQTGLDDNQDGDEYNEEEYQTGFMAEDEYPMNTDRQGDEDNSDLRSPSLGGEYNQSYRNGTDSSHLSGSDGMFPPHHGPARASTPRVANSSSMSESTPPFMRVATSAVAISPSRMVSSNSSRQTDETSFDMSLV